MEDAPETGLFLSITDCIDKSVARDYLARSENCVNTAVNRYYIDKERHENILCQPIIPAPILRIQSNVTRKRPRIFYEADSTFIDTNISLPCDTSVKEFITEIISVWRRTGNRFLDRSFPPSSSSIDGRVSLSDQQSYLEVKCKCKNLARLRTVFKAGPNQNRLFYTCEKRVCNFFQWNDNAAPTSQALELTWMEFHQPKFCLFKSINASPPYRPQDIRQGSVGDCWFLAGLAVVSERADLINRIIQVTPLEDSAGIYQIQLFLVGKWTSVFVDCWLPYKQEISNSANTKSKKSSSKSVPKILDNIKLAFASGIGGQLWPSLVEKAFAKVHGSYQAISGGFIKDAFTVLTGSPTETINLGNDTFNSEETWYRLLSFTEAQFPMGCSTSGESGQGKCGLVQYHAYSILEVREIHNCTEGKQLKIDSFFGTADKNEPNLSVNQTISGPLRLIRIRNPWGRVEWNKDWSARSEQWTAKLKKELDRGDINDGTFWMSYHDFLQRFAFIDVCKSHLNWNYKFMENSIVPTDKSSFFPEKFLYMSQHAYEIQTPPGQGTWCYASIWQPTKRGRQDLYWPSSISLFVIRCVDSSLTLVASILTPPEESIQLELMLEPSSVYRILPFSIGASSQQKFTFGLHSAITLPLKQVSWHEHSSEVHLALCVHLESLYNRRVEVHTECYSLLHRSALFVTETHRGVVIFNAVNAHDEAITVSLHLISAKKYSVEGSQRTAVRILPKKQAIVLVLAAISSDVFTHLDCSFSFDYTVSRVIAADAPSLVDILPNAALLIDEMCLQSSSRKISNNGSGSGPVHSIGPLSDTL